LREGGVLLAGVRPVCRLALAHAAHCLATRAQIDEIFKIDPEPRRF